MAKLTDLTQPHTGSFNALFKENIIEKIILNTDPVEIKDGFGNTLKVVVEELQVKRPFISEKDHGTLDRRLLPKECREKGATYKGKATLKVSFVVNNNSVITEHKRAGSIPIMVKSMHCHLNELEGNELLKVGEDKQEIGGYFIINGNEKMVRLLIAQKRNFIFAFKKPSYQKKGDLFTENAVSFRCVGEDEVGQVNAIHYSSDGNVVIRIFYRKNEYLIPIVLILKALVDTTDEEIYNNLAKSDNVFLKQQVVILLRLFKNFNLHSKKECLRFIGGKFKRLIREKEYTDEEAGKKILEKLVAVHLKKNEDKFNFLILAIKKLYALVNKEIVEDNQDLPMNHELYTELQILALIIKEKINDSLASIKTIYNVSKNRTTINFSVHKILYDEIISKVEFNIGSKIEAFLSSGNLTTYLSSDILQTSGYVILAEKINFYRFFSHFRSVNRGTFFATVKTTTVRKLRPESWGFMCPVHTPDGSPCGLLTHLSHQAVVTTETVNFDTNVIFEYGAIPILRGAKYENMIAIQVDGKIIGLVEAEKAEEMAMLLRKYRCTNNLLTEIIYVPSNTDKFPGIFVYNSLGRFSRPVFNKPSQKIEHIGIMEQVYHKIDLKDEVTDQEESIYQEIDNMNILSLVAGLTPFSNFNQSPRNMYQCQMAKQSMGIPALNVKHRTDTKSYTLTYSQEPLVKTKLYDEYALSNYPIGINVVVAVLAYTAYDMEDAMVINKSSTERGLFHGHIYKNIHVELKANMSLVWLPQVGEPMAPGAVLYKSINLETNEISTTEYKGFDKGHVDTVRIFSTEKKVQHANAAYITLRIPRNPAIGDKFCSRHGQKGVCSMHWPLIDMPFTDQGIVPDIIINPHAFPSRMTIAMLVESLAGKSGALLGKFQDGTPFTFDEDNTAANYFGEELKKCGFNFHGNETMYSGISGNEFQTDIYIGLVYYQRLRHMVGDKFQVRTTGPIQAHTHQPIGGRKNLGGVRLGEMERDALIAHGASYILQDRLMNCSDGTKFVYCCNCKSILFSRRGTCLCKGTEFKEMQLPYVFKYLISELMAMNIRIKIKI